MNTIEKLENTKMYKEEDKHDLLHHYLEITSVHMLAFHLGTGKEAGVHQLSPLLCCPSHRPKESCLRSSLLEKTAPGECNLPVTT